MAVLGLVVSASSGLPWWVIFPDAEHLGAMSCLRELAASDCSPLTVQSYAYRPAVVPVPARVADWLGASRAWLGEVATLGQGLKYLRIRHAEARQRLSHGSNPFADQGPQ